MRVELYIEDKLCDIGEVEDIAIDYAIAKIGDIQGRHGVRSAEFALPKTANNRYILENPDDTNNQSTRPYRKLKARLLIDGVDVGILTCSIKSTTKTYNVNLYGKNVDFFTTIKGRKFSELNYISTNHSWGQSTAISNRGNTSGYIYPIVDNYVEFPNDYIGNGSDVIYTDFLFPALFYNELIEKIVESAGYTLLIDDPLAFEPILPFSSTYGNFKRDKDSNRYIVKLTKSSTQDIYVSADPGIAWVRFDTYAFANEPFYWDTALMNYKSPNFADSVVISGEINLNITNIDSVSATYNVYITYGTNKITNLGTIFLAAGASASYTYTFSDIESLISNHVTFGYEVPAVCDLFIFYNSISEGQIRVNSASFEITSATVKESGRVRILPFCDTNYEAMSYLTPKSIIDIELLQVDLLGDYCRLFGYFVDVDEDTKVVTLFKFKRVVQNQSIAKDWSDKLDLSKDPEIMYAIEGSGQINKIAYTKDELEEKPDNTDYNLLTDNETLPKEVELITVQFAGTHSADRLNGRLTPIYPMIEIGVDNQKLTQRILILDKQSFSLTYKRLGYSAQDLNSNVTLLTVSDDIPMCRFIDPSKTVNLGFGDSLVADNYQYLIDVFDKTRIIRAYFRLNAIDINNLDFKIPVYVDYYKSYFYISGVIEYSPGTNESTLVELVKLF